MSVGRGRGWSGASLRFAALPCLLLSAALASACGRLGFDLSELDAGTRSQAQSAQSSERRLSLNELTGFPISVDVRRDAGMPEPSVQPPTAAGVSQSVDAGMSQPPGLANGEACDADRGCASGACISGVCCESRCTDPGPCLSAQGATCGGGHCAYSALEDGSLCDDDDTCTTGDRCYRGYCFGAPRDCDDAEECTSDFCTDGQCTHASSCNPEGEECSYGLLAEHGYWMCPNALNFASARDACERIGAHLVTVNDAEEQKYLWGRGMRDTWIGYRSGSGRPGSGFEWIYGSSQYRDWADGEPQSGMDRCAYIAAAHGGEWESHACGGDSVSGFACEIEQYAPPDADCSYLRGFGEGYFLCKGPRLWADAQRHCEKVGAALAEISNELEQGYLATFLESGLRYAIGLHDRVQSGQFAWNSGSPLRFEAWDEMQPAPISRGSSYVAMDGHSGRWSTMSAYDAIGFVCEQKR